MSRPVFLLDGAVAASAVLGAVVVLSGPEGRHAATVRRIGPGEQVDLTDGAGRRLTGEVVAAAKDTLDVRIDQIVDEPAPEPRLLLVQALAKGDRDDQAIETATELGVDGIVPWQAQRCIVQWRGERGDKARRKWADTVTAAAKQSRRAWLPGVEEAVDLRRLSARVGEVVQAGGAAYVLHEEATNPLAAQRIPAHGDVLLIVGPEGGITPAELETLTGVGATVVRLGDTVLRSSSAGPAAIAVLSAALRWR